MKATKERRKEGLQERKEGHQERKEGHQGRAHVCTCVCVHAACTYMFKFVKGRKEGRSHSFMRRKEGRKGGYTEKEGMPQNEEGNKREGRREKGDKREEQKRGTKRDRGQDERAGREKGQDEGKSRTRERKGERARDGGTKGGGTKEQKERDEEVEGGSQSHKFHRISLVKNVLKYFKPIQGLSSPLSQFPQLQ